MESADNLVSVIVPTYKRQDYLVLTLQSILAQTHRDVELLVVADGHDELTETVVRDLSDSRAKYLFTPHAGFPAVPRNEGLRNSQGSLLAFCDDDDIWHPTKLAEQIPVLRDGNFGMCATDYDYVDQDGVKTDQRNYYDNYHGPISWQTFFHSMGFICNATGLFTREVYERIGDVNEDPQLKANEDYEYWMRVLYEFDGFLMKEKLVSYRVHQGSIQKNSAWRVLQSRRALHKSMKRSLAIPNADHLRKSAKLWFHFVCDQYPFARRVLRRVQGRQLDS